MADNKSGAVPDSVPVVEAVPQKQKFDFTSLNTLAVVSLASAISIVGALVAVITGHVSLAQIKKSGESGRALAITGLVLGYIHLVGWIIFSILAVVSSALIFSGFMGLQPMDLEYMEFRKGFDGMHMYDR